MNFEERIDISKYTDNEIFQLLDLNNPTDRELEAKLYTLIDKYALLKNAFGRQLSQFYTNIFNHFFQEEHTDDEEEGEEEYGAKEGFETSGAPPTPQLPSTTAVATPPVDPTPSTPPTYIKNIDYTKGNLNPILKETIKRVISIDSSFRETTTYPYSTDFTFNLSETLHDVVSLKLYSIHIPYNWYIINQNYGSNFFYIKGVSDGINNGNFDYKISIPYGNYDAPGLVSALNNSFQSIIATHTDVSFGTTALTYNTTNQKCSIVMDIKNNYNETNYALNFPYITYDKTGNGTITGDNKSNSIPELFGFLNETYYPFTVNSNVFVSSGQFSLPAGLFTISTANNSFNIYTYIPTATHTTFANTTDTPPIDTITVNFGMADGTYTTAQLMSGLNAQLSNHPKILQSWNGNNQISSMIVTTDASYSATNGYRYTLYVRPNRYTTSNIPGQKMVAVFPDESTIWTGGSSCFNFPSRIMELQYIYSEKQSVTTTYIVETSPFILLKCIAPGYGTNPANSQWVYLNNQTINVSNSPSSGYVLSEYFAAIQAGMDALSVSTSGQMVCSINNTNTNSYAQLSITINTVIPTQYFKINLAGCILNTKFNLPTTINGNAGSVFATSSNTVGGYNVTYSNNTIIIDSISETEGNNRYMISSRVSIAEGIYGGLNDLIDAFNTAFNTYTENNLNLTGMSINAVVSGGETVQMTMFVNIQAILTNKDYELYFVDELSKVADNDNPIDGLTTYTTGNSKNVEPNTNMYYWYDTINQQYVTTNSWARNFGFTYYLYSLNPPVGTNTTTVTGTTTLYNNLLQVDSSNNHFNITPLYDASGGAYNTLTTSNAIPFTLDLPINHDYTKEQVRDSINRSFAGNPITVGSYINTDGATTIFRMNFNRTFTAKDYAVIFFETNSFTKCNFGPNASAETTTDDTTVGWTLGFRTATEYYPVPANVSYNTVTETSYYGEFANHFTYDSVTGIAVLEGDTSVNVNLYNYFLIVLDDYTQNHLNDGLVTTINADLDVALPSYASKASYKRNPITDNQNVSNITSSFNHNSLTNAQIYSSNQILNAQQTKYTKNVRSSGPFIQDIFGIIPVKTAGLGYGQTYTEFGGTLQIQERVYFGPVNIRRMTVKMMTDKGNILDLNGQNWSFSLITEQLYNPSRG